MHGWIHERLPLLNDEKEEQRLLNLSIETLQKMTGKRPVGYRAPSWKFSKWTMGQVKAAGFLYDSSLMASDDPCELLLDGKPTGVVELPIERILDDAPYFGGNADGSMPSVSGVYEVFQSEFDVAYEEGGLYLLTMHPHLIGHRSRVALLERLVQYEAQARRVVRDPRTDRASCQADDWQLTPPESLLLQQRVLPNDTGIRLYSALHGAPSVVMSMRVLRWLRLRPEDDDVRSLAASPTARINEHDAVCKLIPRRALEDRCFREPPASSRVFMMSPPSSADAGKFRLLNRHRQSWIHQAHTAIDAHELPRDPVGFARAEQGHGVADICRRAQSPHRCPAALVVIANHLDDLGGQ